MKKVYVCGEPKAVVCGADCICRMTNWMLRDESRDFVKLDAEWDYESGNQFLELKAIDNHGQYIKYYRILLKGKESYKHTGKTDVELGMQLAKEFAEELS